MKDSAKIKKTNLFFLIIIMLIALTQSAFAYEPVFTVDNVDDNTSFYNNCDDYSVGFTEGNEAGGKNVNENQVLQQLYSYSKPLIGADTRLVFSCYYGSYMVPEDGWYEVSYTGSIYCERMSFGTEVIPITTNDWSVNVDLVWDDQENLVRIESMSKEYNGWTRSVGVAVETAVLSASILSSGATAGAPEVLKGIWYAANATYEGSAQLKSIVETIDDWQFRNTETINKTTKKYLEAGQTYQWMWGVQTQLSTDTLLEAAVYASAYTQLTLDSITVTPLNPSSLNNPPTLSNPCVSPVSGTQSTNFEFLVDYYDPDGDAPDAAYKMIYISGGHEGTMSLKSGSVSNGTYSYTTTLPVGSYSFNFLFTDSKGSTAFISSQPGPYVYTNDSTIEIKSRVNGSADSTSNIEIEFGYGPDLSNLEKTKWLATELPQYLGIDSGQKVEFDAHVASENHTFIKWEFRDDQGNLIRESSSSGYFFTLLSGNLHARAIFDYTPRTYTISGTVLSSDGSLIPGGVDLTLSSPEQTIVQHIDNGNFSFNGIEGGNAVSITPYAKGYAFAPTHLVYSNLIKNISLETIRGYSSDDLSPTTSFVNFPPAVNNNSTVTFSWIGQDDTSTTENLLYQYKLLGYDTDWSDFSNLTSKTYDVNNGIYTFQVVAKDEAGNINQVPTNCSFVVNAAPKVLSTSRISNSVWASQITLQMPPNSSHPTQSFVLLPEHSCIEDSELEPLTIHLPNNPNPLGGNSIISNKLGIPTLIVKDGKRWIATLPDSITDDQTVQYDIKWGKIKYFGWQDIVEIPKGFPNLTVGTNYRSNIEYAYLDEQFRMWRHADKQQKRLGGVWGATKTWNFMDIANKETSLVSERILDYVPGIPYDGSYACDYIDDDGKIIRLGNNICYLWTTEKYEKVGGSDYETFNYNRYSLALVNMDGNIINTYRGEWLRDVSLTILNKNISNKIFIVGEKINSNNNTHDLFFITHNSNGELLQNATVFESVPSTNSGDLYFYGCWACGNNTAFLFTKSYDTLQRDDRQEVCVQIRDASGNLIKPTIALNPALLPDSIEDDDEYEFESAITDNSGKLWISFSNRDSDKNYYTIIGSNGNIWKDKMFIGINTNREYEFCDKDGYIWVTENSDLLIFNSDDTIAFSPRTITFIPNQNTGTIAVSRDSDGEYYRLYDRWFPQLVQIDIPEDIYLKNMELYDLDVWNNGLHTTNPTVKYKDSVIWSSSGQFNSSAIVDVNGVLSSGENLLTITQDDFMGGQLLITFPYMRIIDGDFNKDQTVNFLDFCIFAKQWGLGYLFYDIKNDGIINFQDFARYSNFWNGSIYNLSDFTAEWLKSGLSQADVDIAPKPNSDGVVDILDLMLFAESWLVGDSTAIPVKIAVINPDYYRVLKCGVVDGDDTYVSIPSAENTSNNLGILEPGAQWTCIGTHTDFIGTILEQADYQVDYFESSAMPDITPSDYMIVIVQDPLRTYLSTFDKAAVDAGNLPNLLQLTANTSFLTKLDNYIMSGGKVIMVGDAVRLLENGTNRLNYGKSINAISPSNTVDLASSWIPENWLFTRGNPFCGADREAYGSYQVSSGELIQPGTILSNIAINNRSDLPYSHLWSDTIYKPSDAVSLLSVNFSGQGEYVLDGSTCSPTVYSNAVNETIDGFIGYTEYNGRNIYYLGSDSFFDYNFKDWNGAWHTGQSMEINSDVTIEGENMITCLINYIKQQNGFVVTDPDWIVRNGDFLIVNGTLSESAKGTDYSACVSATVGENVKSFQVDFVNPPQGGRGEHSMWFFITKGYSSNGFVHPSYGIANGYVVVLYWDNNTWGTPADYMRLYRLDNGVLSSAIDTGAMAGVTRDGNKHTVKLTIENGQIKSELDSVVQHLVNDSTYTTFDTVTINSYMKYYDIDAVFDNIIITLRQ